ncbi:MAG: alpha/beta fold hydrolase [Alphaproteobacteria bacterium]
MSKPLLTRQLQKLSAVQSLANTEFDQALLHESVARMRRFIAGIKAYQYHYDQRDVVEAPVIWQDGTTSLRDYNPSHSTAPIILVIPSLINRFHILDLDFASSFLRRLAAEGFRPLVVDWDHPGEKEKSFSLTDYVTKRLLPILDFLQSSQTNPVHVMGYCMGGLLALALATLQKERVKTLTLLATPWDFHKPNPDIASSFIAVAEQMEPCLQATGLLPVDVIQSLFAGFQPMQVLNKFSEFASLDPDSMEARQFVLLEDWLNDGVPLTAPVARECLIDWYGENYTAKLDWHIDGTIIDPRTIQTPSYVVVPGRDHIVPPESALPLARLLPRASLHEPMMGHIGMIVSRNASHQVWSPLFKWLSEHR